MLSATHIELLTPGGMARARTIVINSHSWFVHVSGLDRLAGLKASGIEPRNPGATIDAVIAAALGDGSGAIVCLRPIFAFNTRPNRDYPQMLLSISNSDLPQRIGIDWSYPGSWNLVDVKQREAPEMRIDVIFAHVVQQSGSIASYDLIPAEVVRVWAKGTPENDPSKWPSLLQIAAADVSILP
ncbi:hypothetical protein [Mesorhizobium sp. B263B2A]|uniref:hypothetical protein n=1 Tax=Mesorhizobium sp. B263B2A TaxID=2876669 RepID=UPI001CD08B4C|nr:hypothetical protein [Mesorhizobium sp. B263B2A]MCA0032640.1 hypothetical protein [Mesorhizobium sp. B263B2A]